MMLRSWKLAVFPDGNVARCASRSFLLTMKHDDVSLTALRTGLPWSTVRRNDYGAHPDSRFVREMGLIAEKAFILLWFVSKTARITDKLAAEGLQKLKKRNNLKKEKKFV